MPSQKRKEKQKLLQKANENCLSIKTIFERNESSTSSHTDTHPPDFRNDLHVSYEIIQPEETSNYDHPITNLMKIIGNTLKIQNIRMLLLTES